MTRIGCICALAWGWIYLPSLVAEEVHQPTSVLPVTSRSGLGFFPKDLPDPAQDNGISYEDVAPVRPAAPRHFRSVRVIDPPAHDEPVPIREPLHQQVPLGADKFLPIIEDIPPSGDAPPPQTFGPIDNFESTAIDNFDSTLIGSGCTGCACPSCRSSACTRGPCHRCGRPKSCPKCRGWDLTGWFSWGTLFR